MRVLVCGGRNWNDQDRMDAALDAVHRKHGVTLLIEGGQVSRDRETDTLFGADWQAGTWAIRRKVPHWICWAWWFDCNGKISRAAGPERNAKMIRVGQPDGVVAMPGGAGTADMIRKARAAGLTVWQPYGAKR